MSIIKIKDNLGTPKYKQIITSIEDAIVNGKLKKGDPLPSINSIRNKFSISRDTVLMAYNSLKLRGIIQSIPGKGYYLKSENIHITQKIFLLFDELNSFKEDLYNSFLQNVDNNIEVDIYFHHFNPNVFSKLIDDSLGNYNAYIIMPANITDTHLIIEKLPKDRVYILDQINENLSGYPAIYQNFEKDIFNSLTKSLHLLKKYKTLVFLFPIKSKQPAGMLKGFKLFCKTNNYNNEIINTLDNRVPKKGEVYLIADDKSLIQIIKKIKEKELSLGNEIGIISYNDTLLKEIVEDGITTISTDFNYMGKRLAEMIMNKEQIKIENPNKLIVRNSL